MSHGHNQFDALSIHHHTSLFMLLIQHSASWKEIGIHLGFRPSELDEIQSRPSLYMTAPSSWLSAMLEKWLQWAPGDSRASDRFATLKDLQIAVYQAGLGAIAEMLSVSLGTHN